MDYTLAGAVILSGVGIVFLVLVLLTLLLLLFGAVLNRKDKPQATDSSGAAAQAKPALTPVPGPQKTVQVQDGVTDEVVAVISAAVAISMGTGVAVRGVKRAGSPRKSRTAWSLAGMQKNTSPF